MTSTNDLPVSILGVSRTVTLAQARKIMTSVSADYVRVGIAARFLCERGKGKSVRAMAQDLGLSSAQAGRVAIAADIVWQIGTGATDADAANALTLVNTVQANGLGKATGFLPEGATGKALSKALAQALPTARDQVKSKATDSPKGKSGARSGKVTSTGPRTDKGRADLAASTLAAIGGKVAADTAEAILAQAIRVALVSLPAGRVADVVADVLADTDAADTAEAV